jgi:hypothetical protein
MPIEWNIMMIFGGWFLFGAHPEVSITAVLSMPFLTAFLAFMLVFLPAFGNFFPRHLSFLLSMRYYAGNWAYNIWWMRKPTETSPAASDKLKKLTCSSGSMREQLEAMLPDAQMVDLAMEKAYSARFLHMEGKPLLEALPRLFTHVDGGTDDYEWWESEVLAGQALGWNFGDGHLGNENLLTALQEQCEWEEGEVVCLMVESQPLFGHTMKWRIVDAATGLLEEGETDIRAMRHETPYPDGEYAEAIRQAGGPATN